MSNLANAHFDDSEEEDDNFNPAPADLSDNEDARGSDHDDDDAGAQIQKEAARRQSRDDASEDGSTTEQVKNRRRGFSEDGDHDDEDDEGEGDDTAPAANDDEEEDDEEDDDEEEITVSFHSLFWAAAFAWGSASEQDQVLIALLGSSKKTQTRAPKPVSRCRS